MSLAAHLADQDHDLDLDDEAERAPGFFSMELINRVATIRDLGEAKRAALDAVAARRHAMEHNKRKAASACEHCTTVKALLVTMTNFMLAHEGMRVGRRPEARGRGRGTMGGF